MADCPLLHGLPPELRLRVYELILPRNRSLKLRRHVPATLDLAILRACRQTYAEALPVLYDSNTILVTRNDFCKHTTPDLQTPVNLEQACHLNMVSFNKPIACTLDSERGACDVCQSHAIGLIRTLASMPRLKTTLVEHHRLHAYVGELTQYLDLNLANSEGLELVPNTMTIHGPVPRAHSYYLQGPAFEGKKIMLMDCN